MHFDTFQVQALPGTYRKTIWLQLVFLENKTDHSSRLQAQNQLSVVKTFKTYRFKKMKFELRSLSIDQVTRV